MRTPSPGEVARSLRRRRQPAMIGTDTWGLEVVPFEKNAGVFEVHQHHQSDRHQVAPPLQGLRTNSYTNSQQQ